MQQSVVEIDLGGRLQFIATGKVREIYEINKSTLLFVTTDRM